MRMPRFLPRPDLVCFLWVLATSTAILPSQAESPRQFLGYESLRDFVRTTNGSAVECLSPHLLTRVPWDELILSWNVHLTGDGHLKLEARAHWADRRSQFYTLGLWSADSTRQPRESVTGQKDADGNVETDTLVLRELAPGLQLRLTFAGGAGPHQLSFLGVCAANTRTRLEPLSPNRAAWGRTIDTPRKSQLNYPGGENEWCSPTSVSMILNHWAERLGRKDLELDVPAVVQGVHDPKWPGTGNWPFNMAFAGSLPGLRAYVTRLDDVSELEDWVAAGIPVATSLSYNLLRGRSDPGNGHLVVVVGFTDTGDVIVNDPGTRLDNVRRTFPRANLIRAWAASKNTVYIIHPTDHPTPADLLGHWDTRARKPPATSP